MTEIHDPDELIELGAQLGGQATNATERDPAAFDRAIETYTVALTALPPDDRRVTKVAAALGTLRGFKYVLFGGPDTDLDEAITTLDEVKENESADEKFVAAAHAMRGVLRLLRVYPMLRESDLTLRRLFENASPADERDREDVLRASADLSVAASANGVLPDRLRDLADLTQIGADLFLEVAASSGGNPSIDSMARLINEGLARLDPCVQGYTEMTIAAVWTKCM